MRKNILVVAPHPDDESIGCGGAICLHHERGDTVQVVTLTSGERNLMGAPPHAAPIIREAEAREAAVVLGVEKTHFFRLPDSDLLGCVKQGAQQLHTLLDVQMPDVIYLPHPDDAHVDHMAAALIVRSALSRMVGQTATPTLRTYEIWTPLTHYNTVENITPVIGKKLRAIRCHRSQLAVFRHDDAAEALARYRGVMTGDCGYAEVFWDIDHRRLHERLRRLILFCRTPSRFPRIRKVASYVRNGWSISLPKLKKPR